MIFFRVKQNILFKLLLLPVCFLCYSHCFAQLSIQDFEKIIQARQDAVSAAGFSIDNSLILSAVNYGETAQLTVFSIKDCEEKKRFNFQGYINTFALSSADQGTVWIGTGHFLKKISLSDGAELYSEDLFNAPVKGIYISKENVLVWGNNKAVLLKESKDGVSKIIEEDLPFNISGAAYDSAGGYIYISGFNGVLMRVSSAGGVKNSYSLPDPVKAMFYDPKGGLVLLGMDSGLVKFGIQGSDFVKVTSVPAENISIAGNFMVLNGKGVYSMYAILI